MILTLTGFDNDCSMTLMEDLCQINDISLEIGILYYPKKFGQPRYPDLIHIEKFGRLPIRKALHICGNEAIREFLDADGERDDIYLDHPRMLYDLYDRIQLNADWSSALFRDSLERIGEYQVILQWNEKNKRIFDRFWDEIPPNTQFLMDESGGNGSALTRNWIAAEKELSPYTDVGFAGGISPDTIDNDLIWIKEHFNNPNPWIDMESGIRSNNQMDFQKVAEVIEIFREALP